MSDKKTVKFAENENGEIALTLDYPIVKDDGSKVAELKFRPPLVGDIEKMDEAKGDVAKNLKLLTAITGLSYVAIKKMHGRDYIKAKEILGYFLGESPEDGETTSQT